MDVPSPSSGRVRELAVKVGDKATKARSSRCSKRAPAQVRNRKQGRARPRGRPRLLHRRHPRTGRRPPPKPRRIRIHSRPHRSRSVVVGAGPEHRARRLQGRARDPVGAEVRARARRRSLADPRHRTEGAHRARRRAGIREGVAAETRSRGAPRLQAAVAAACTCRRGRTSTSPRFGPVETRRCRASRRSPAPICTAIGWHSARHSVRRGRHHRSRSVPRRAQQGELAKRGVKVTMLAFLIKASVASLKEIS